MKKLLAAPLLVAGILSCTSVDKNLGGDLIATDQKYDIYSAEFDLNDIQMRPVDSLTAYSSRRINFGTIRDETFGLVRRGSVVTMVPVRDSVDFGKDPIFQRMSFRTAVDSTSVADVSQKNIIQNVNVYALDEPLDSKNYFSRAEVKHGDKRITKGVPVINGTDSLAFDFTAEYGKKYLGITQDDLKDYETYCKKFPGIYFCTDDPVGEGGRLNLFEMDILRVVQNSNIVRTNNYAILYYSGIYKGERRDTSLMFYFSPMKMQNLDSLITVRSSPQQYVFNVDYHESDDLAGAAQETIRVEGGSGLKPVFSASEIKKLAVAEILKQGGDPGTAIISKATIDLPFDFPDDYTTMYRFPKILSPTVRIKAKDVVNFAGLTDASVETENQGEINRSLCKYSPDITHHVQQIIRKEDGSSANYDIWFLIMWYEVTTTTNAEASQMADYYRQIAYYSYYNQLYGGYGGGYGGYGGGYGGYGYGSYYSNYYNYMLMAEYASSAATTSKTQTELDKDRYYCATLHGPKSAGAKPKLKITFAIPKK